MSRQKTRAGNSEIHNRRNMAALGHALRYRIVTPDALAACHEIVFPTLATARRTCLALQKQGLLSQAELYRQESYFYLTARGGAKMGAETIDASEKPFSESAKIHALAFVEFCCLQGKHRTRLTRDEIKKHFSDLYRPGIATNYYVDLSEEPPLIGFVRVDRGGHGRWDRIVAKAHDDVEAHWLEPGFRQLIERGRFELRVITSLQQKADRIHQTLTTTANRRKVSIHITAIPKLINLIHPPSIMANNRQINSH